MKRAVIIGINYYGTGAQLSGCINDINDIQQYLRSIGYTDFIRLADRADDPDHSDALSPTKAHILSALSKAVGETQPQDTLYVHYSGHGSYTYERRTSPSKDEIDGRDETICPVDYPTAGDITDDELNSILVTPFPSGAKLRVVFDCCHSGSSIDLPYRWAGTTGGREKWHIENSSASQKDIVMISGCKDEQTSADAYIENNYNGALTWALLRSLSDIKKSGKNATKYRWKDLMTMLRLKLLKGGYDQIPQVSFTHKELIGEKVDI